MKKKLLLAFWLLMSLSVAAQSFTDSNLPIVVIETDGDADIPDEPKILGTMKIIWHQDGSRNYMSYIDDPEFLNYNGRIAIELYDVARAIGVALVEVPVPRCRPEPAVVRATRPDVGGIGAGGHDNRQ